MKKMRNITTLALLVCLCFAVGSGTDVRAKKKIKLNKTKLKITVSQTYQLKLKNYKKKVKWSSSKKKVASVSSKGKVNAKKAGTTIITAKASGKKYRCTVTVKAKKTIPDNNNTPEPDKDFTKTVAPDYPANYAQLKNTIQLYGYVNETGSPAINGTLSSDNMHINYGIEYNAVNRRFCFMLTTHNLLENDTALGSLKLYISEDAITNAAADYEIEYDSGFNSTVSSACPLTSIHK